ncbi:unnamed protein product [Fructobacillus cardui]|nr:unnamed protein product [Fructobacillus cardui]
MMKKIYFRKKGEETIHDAELLTKRVKKIRIDSDGKVLSFTVVPNNEYILKNLKTHCLKRTNLKFGLSMMITRRALFTLKDD